MIDSLLSATQLTKQYGGVTVLDRVDLDVRRGEVHALLGANGAGKSTLCRIVAGLTPATAGSMTLAGAPFAPRDKHRAEAAGVQIVQQELNLIPTLSVAENLQLTRLPARAGVIRRRQLHDHALHALRRVGLEGVDPRTLVQQLGVGRQQLVEIAAALDQQCRLLILDEPTAALTAAETATLFQQLVQLRASGVGVVYISHRLEEVSRLADRITILRDGKHVCTRSASGFTSAEMVELMSGTSTTVVAEGSFQSHATDDVALRVEGLESADVHMVSFMLRRGERLGVAGLIGSGRTELLRLIFGADRARRGGVAVGDAAQLRRFRSPSEAVAAGLAMITEDRKQTGLLLEQPVRVNATLAALASKFSSAGLIRRQRERQAAEDMVRIMETHCTGVEQLVGTLSGGNQQKVVAARWLLRDARVFLFDEPTRGIDVAARRRIYQLLQSLAAEGKSLVIVSSDLDELLEACDRIAVMSAGALVAIYNRGEWSHEGIMQAAFSRYAESRSHNELSPQPQGERQSQVTGADAAPTATLHN